MAYEQKDIDAGACLDISGGDPNLFDPESHIAMVLKARVQKLLTTYFQNGRPCATSETVGRRIYGGNNSTPRTFIVAGGALLHGTPKDIDVWPGPGEIFYWLEIGKTEMKDLVGEPPVQLVNKPPESLTSLIESFDFAHCQVGAKVTFRPGTSNIYEIPEVAYTPQWLAAMAVQGTFYSGDGERWQSSLARISSVAKKLHLNDNEARTLTKQIIDRKNLEPK